MPANLVSPTVQSTALSIFSNLLAQIISSYKNDTPISFNLAAVFNFAVYTIISTPPNILWQSFLEDVFPTNVPAAHPTPASKPASANGKEKPASQKTGTRTSKTNVIMKFLLDMTLGAVLNNLMFLVFMGYANAPATATSAQASWAAVQHEVKEKFWVLMKDGLKLWPFVSLVSFLFVPVERRVLLGSLVGVGWNIYLSLLAG
ncbi:integral membrane protein-like protein [Westerdykella ornata]|uniref:Integral membrane protein-like protein n=1 Tax=Westerdykella ornata TaxID=318751 RepID=A0A6A6JA90_WESOR|nr:integral membrane protein-like protein [Westerdykella ornata]KAF2272888.1 integral membrane protein-like protein [Westerdykella ornata]